MTTSINEDFLHFVWRYKYFNSRSLKTTEGKCISIKNPGLYNENAGPDFQNASIEIDGTFWHGHVEIHINSSSWKHHGHAKDPQYQNVILHVVLNNDVKIKFATGEEIPCLELKDRLDEKLWQRYTHFKATSLWVPCQNHLKNLDPVIWQLWKHSVLVQRLESKTKKIKIALVESNFDWEQCFYARLLVYTNARVNKLACLRLAEKLPWRLINRYRDNYSSLMALFLGQANLLKNAKVNLDQEAWKEEYLFLSKKHKLRPMSASYWKFSRMRPHNFPSIRLALMAKLLFEKKNLFRNCIEAKDLKELQKIFEVKISDGFWYEHYSLFSKSSPIKKSFGKALIYSLIINVIVPFKFMYGKIEGTETIKEEAMDLLEKIKPEKNKIVQTWEIKGLTALNAYDSQALIHLKENYCEQFKCLQCSIGHAILCGE